jgi:peptide-methionine (S)-S-oxide reductase
MTKETKRQEIYLAGGCLWGVQEYIRHLPGITWTQAGRANGSSNTTLGDYDGYTECVRTQFDPAVTSVEQLIDYFFEIIDPYSLNRQGDDIEEKYRTGIYSKDSHHLVKAKNYIKSRDDAGLIVVEVLPLSNYVESDAEHQDRLTRCPDDYCHIPEDILYKYRS